LSARSIKREELTEISREKDFVKLAEQRRADLKKSLSRNLEVCDLLDMRDVQAVAENAQLITNYLL
jgi:hypothetical protein